MKSRASTPDRNSYVFIPHAAEKGDCLFCPDGVLYRDEEVQEAYGVSEGYTCDCCCSRYIEGYLLKKRRPWDKRIPRRYFTVVDRDYNSVVEVGVL